MQIPTILELAEKFGVCRQTVSKAMKELTAEGYVIGRKGVGTFTNPAKFMEHQFGERFPVIGIFFRDGHGTHLSTYDAHVAAALLKRISLLPAIVQLATAEGTSPEEIKSAVESRNFDAVIWEQPDEKRLEALRLLTAETGTPVVTTGEVYDGFPGVAINQEKAGYDCAKLLIAEGRKHPVFMGNYGPWLRQVRGFRRSYEEAGIPLNDKLFLKHQNLDALRNIIELGVPVDAVFNHPNLIRNEIFHLMQEMHIDVENECRLISATPSPLPSIRSSADMSIRSISIRSQKLLFVCCNPPCGRRKWRKRTNGSISKSSNNCKKGTCHVEEKSCRIYID